MLVIVAPVTSSRLAALLAGAWAALAAWVSFGAMAFTGPSAARIGVLPRDPVHLAIAIAAGLAVIAIGWRAPRGAAIAVSPLALVLLPWLPFSVPAAFLIWTGAMTSLVWIAAALALACVVRRDWTAHVPSHRGALSAGVLAFVIFAIAAWCASPSLPGGDEPHYLVITQSLLYDHDLKIENNHQRGDYRAYYQGDLAPHSVRRGRNGEIYSIHAPGVPALVLPAFAIAGYHGVVVFLLLLSASGCALAWWLAWRVTGRRDAAWFGWASVTFAAPFLLESYTVFPDGPGAIVVLTGVWALLRADWERTPAAPSKGPSALLPWFLHGLALSTLPWMHTRFAVLAATLGGLVLVRLARAANPLPKAIAFLTGPALGALAWLFFFVVIYGTPDPTAPYGGDTQNSFAFLTNGLGGLLFDQGFGVFATAPVLAVAIAGFARTRRLALEWLVVAAPYLLAVTTYAMWWAGMSGPARFLVPLLLPLAIPAACAWAATRSRGTHAVMIAALLVSAWLALVMAGAGGGRLGYHSRNEGGMTAAPWMEWANHLVDLPAAFPAFVPLPVGTALGARINAAHAGIVATLPWLICLGAAAWLAAWLIDRRPRAAETAVAQTALVFGAAVMAASMSVWEIHRAAPMTLVPAQMDVLRAMSSRQAIGLDLTGRRRLPSDDALAMRIEAPIRRGGRGGARIPNRPLAAFPLLPAGSYELSVTRHGAGDGWVMAGVGNDQFAIVTQPIDVVAQGVRIDLPVTVRSLSIRAEEGGREQLDAVVLRPLALAPRPSSDDMARRAVRYASGVAFFLDDRSFPEPAGFWVGGARDSEIIIQLDRPGGTAPLSIRNGSAENTLTLESARWREQISLHPGEERRIDVPVDASQPFTRLRLASASGFRPSDVDHRSRDTRFLGVFVRLQ